MCSANLDDVLERLGFCVESVVQLLQVGQQQAVDLHGHGNVHRGGKCVVAALTLVHVIVRMHRCLGAQLASEQFYCSVADHLENNLK